MTVQGTHCISRSFPLPPQRMPAGTAAASAAPGPAPHAHPAASKRLRNQRVCTPSLACPENTVFCIWQPCALDSGNKITASAHGMGSGGLPVDAIAIGCLGVDRRGERFFVLSHFSASRCAVASARSTDSGVRRPQDSNRKGKPSSKER